MASLAVLKFESVLTFIDYFVDLHKIYRECQDLNVNQGPDIGNNIVA